MHAGNMHHLEASPLPKNVDTWQVVVDRFPLPAQAKRITQALELAFQQGAGHAQIWCDGTLLHELSQKYHCSACQCDVASLSAGYFSFNNPLGACASCKGFGRAIEIDLEKIVPDATLTLNEGAIRPWTTPATQWEQRELKDFCRRHQIPRDKSYQSLSQAQKSLLMHGEVEWKDWRKGQFPGVLGWFSWLETRTYKMHVRVLLSRYRLYSPCPSCKGTRFNAQALCPRVGKKNIAEIYAMTLAEAAEWLKTLKFTGPQKIIAKPILADLNNRLQYLLSMGLDYLTLDRQARTLSGGEAQRVHLTTALGAKLTGVLYVLDEPSVGLHARDTARLYQTIAQLTHAGNTLVVIEHDSALMKHADHIIDLGPNAGAEGGSLMFQGSYNHLLKQRTSLTGRLLNQERRQAQKLWPAAKHPQASQWLEIHGAKGHNLKNINVKIPLGQLCAITGVSGSGKSSLLYDVIYAALKKLRGEKIESDGHCTALKGGENFSQITLLDQSPLSRTPKANTATYLKIWTPIRKLFAATPSAKKLKLSAADFSFNSGQGRCPHCEGSGFEKVEMQFLSDMLLPCPRCHGQRFQAPVLSVDYQGQTIAAILSMTIDEAHQFWQQHHDIVRPLTLLQEIGLGYLPLGQGLNTLSGGEAQRLKLAQVLLAKKGKKATAAKPELFLLDEPTTGLHLHDVQRLLKVLQKLCDQGHTIIAIEHHLGLIASADYIIDLGPEGGAKGGQVVSQGDLNHVSKHPKSLTAKALRDFLKGSVHEKKERKHLVMQTPPQCIQIKGAKENNLKVATLEIAHNQLSVISGPSGSGKSTLAFDLIHAEGQRRYLESLSSYARQFVGSLHRAQVETLQGVAPSVAIEQRTTRGGQHSSVATLSEIAHYLRLIYAKLSAPECSHCHTLCSKRLRKHHTWFWQCKTCKNEIQTLDPLDFSISNPESICPRCQGLPLKDVICGKCHGTLMHPKILRWRWQRKDIAAINAMTLAEAKHWFSHRRLKKSEQDIAERLLAAILQRLEFLSDVGLDYLTLERRAPTLSGGELQRIRLASQLGAELTGALYVLDEPTIGLHPRDNARLLKTLKTLSQRGNTVIVVEHDEDTMAAADTLIEMGPSGGTQGGKITYQGPPSQSPSLYAIALNPPEKSEISQIKKTKFLHVNNACRHNLKNIQVHLPHQAFTCISGVSGSGKSTLVHDIVYLGLKDHWASAAQKPHNKSKKKSNFNAASFENIETLSRAVHVDQSPIGKTPSSVPASYMGLMDPLRQIFASLPSAKMAGFKASRFSFNLKEGRCEHCRGQGRLKVEMNFLPLVTLDCDACLGQRYNRETLAIELRRKTIADILNMTFTEAHTFFHDYPRLKTPLKFMIDIGLGYIKLGQPSPSLSGGEAQRLKLAKELATSSAKKTLYILDEPTTGLHARDICELLHVLKALVQKGHSVVVIEHHLGVLSQADWVVDLGPEGGDKGGRVVYQGPPDKLLKCRKSHTAKALKQALQRTHA